MVTGSEIFICIIATLGPLRASITDSTFLPLTHMRSQAATSAMPGDSPAQQVAYQNWACFRTTPTSYCFASRHCM
jgi:hypothetical protein